MREEWKYKKLGEVCTIKAGYTPQKNELSDNGAYPYYKVADMNTLGNDVYLDITSSYKIDANKLFPKGAIVFPKNGAAVSTNKKRILKYDSIVDLNTGVAIFPKSINEKFAYYWFIDTDFKKYVRGGALPTLDIKSLKDKPFPSIDKSIQLAIVSELDKINELIRLKKEQLKDFDNLAQSLFYEMFGDPVENEMGWEVKMLGDACTDITDGDHMPPPKSEYGIPFITISDIDKESRSLNFENTFYVPIDYYNKLKENRKARIGDLLYTVTGSYGIPVIVKTDKQFCFQRHIALLRPNIEILSTIFLYYWMLNDGVKFMADKVAKGIAQKTVGLNSIRKFSCILPPLPLQHLFAHRIEQIEHQKAEVQKAITDLETLLASRMQYWFE